MDILILVFISINVTIIILVNYFTHSGLVQTSNFMIPVTFQSFNFVKVKSKPTVTNPRKAFAVNLCDPSLKMLIQKTKELVLFLSAVPLDERYKPLWYSPSLIFGTNWSEFLD